MTDPDKMSVEYNKRGMISSLQLGKIEARTDFEEVKTLKEQLLGNDPDNDFSLKLSTEEGGSVVIRPLDAPELLRAAKSDLGALGITCYDKDGKQVGTLSPEKLARIL